MLEKNPVRQEFVSKIKIKREPGRIPQSGNSAVADRATTLRNQEISLQNKLSENTSVKQESAVVNPNNAANPAFKARTAILGNLQKSFQNRLPQNTTLKDSTHPALQARAAMLGNLQKSLQHGLGARSNMVASSMSSYMQQLQVTRARFIAQQRAYASTNPYYRQMQAKQLALMMQQRNPGYAYSQLRSIPQYPVPQPRAVTPSPTHGLPKRFKEKKEEYWTKMKDLVKQFKFYGPSDYWDILVKTDVLEKFKQWRAKQTERVAELPLEQMCMVAVYVEDRGGTLTEIVDSLQKVLGLESSETIIPSDLLRATILRVASRKQYGIKPFFTYNEYEQPDVDDLKFIWEADAAYIVDDRMARLHKSRRQERKRIQIAIGHYWLYHKKLRTSKVGDQKEALLQGQIDRITTWEARHDTVDKTRELRQAKLNERKEERERQRILRQKQKEEARLLKEVEIAAKIAEKAKKFEEKERLRLEREKKQGELALHQSRKQNKKNEVKRTRNHLVNFLRSIKRADVSKRSENSNLKFVALEPQFGVKYARPQVNTIGPFHKLFAAESFDFVSQKLLEYRAHEYKYLSSRSEGRRPWKWSYRHFHEDHRKPWSGVESRASNQLFGRRPFSKEEEDIDYDAADSGIEWYGDIEEKDMLMDDEEGEWLHEELETFSDDEMQEGLRPDGYEDDGFLCEDVNIYFTKTRKKEERYPIKPSRGRGSEEVKPIIFKLPRCKPILEQEKTEDLEFQRFIHSRAGLEARSNALILTELPRRVPPQSVKSWLRKILLGKRKRKEDNKIRMFKVRKLNSKDAKAKTKKKGKKKTQKRKRVNDEQSSM